MHVHRLSTFAYPKAPVRTTAEHAYQARAVRMIALQVLLSELFGVYILGVLARACLGSAVLPVERVGRTNAAQADVHTGRRSAWHEGQEIVGGTLIQPDHRAHLLVFGAVRSALFAPIATPNEPLS